MHEAPSVCMPPLIATQVLLDMECISAVLFITLGTNLYPHVLIMSGTGDVHVYEGPKDKKKKKGK